MNIILSILLIFITCGYSQIPEEALAASGSSVVYIPPPPFSPTNAGLSSLGWWCVSSNNYITNGASVFWTNLLSNGPLLTNYSASGTRPNKSGDLLQFRNANNTLLNGGGLGAFSNPSEFWLVVYPYADSDFSWRAYFDTFVGSGRMGCFQHSGSTTPVFEILGTSAVDSPVGWYSNWVVLNIVYNGASSSIYTNGTLLVSGDTGTASADGITLGAYWNVGFPNSWIEMDLREFGIFGAVMSSADRSSLVTLMRNKYGF